jgi:hypothetical protein
MTQAVSHQHLTMGAQVQPQASLCGIYGGQSGNGTGFSLSTLVLLCHYHFLMFPSQLWSHLLPIFYNVCN